MRPMHKEKPTYRQAFRQIIEDGDNKWQDLPPHHRVGEGEGDEEGLEGGDAGLFPQPQARLLADAHGAAHPLGNGVGQLSLHHRLTARPVS
ncbi:hypothetical protein AVEN_258352-1 [Araneus ventricosus]|uniref:Uncharacterized protein n=1 Tax=Araneus ventricosus TaxID=182803 RepID=A0A4Y2WQC3_ARAVE|nr:hypothetical protein AVEN_258352-1 [Araneus ventricosus]